MDTRAVQQSLVHIGWPLVVDGATGPQTRQAVEDFQYGYGRAGIRLTVDGVVGPKTQAAITRCLSEDGRLSAHFAFREFACKHCGWIKVHWSLPTALEQYRARLSPNGLGVVSGYHCPSHNAAIGGASNSQHLHVNLGNALDVEPYFTVPQVRDAGAGITAMEVRQATGERVWHTDCRPGDPGNPLVFGWGLRDDGC